ncbi:MAG TPA: GNAT family N-acetyltransferase [Streptosporangiaceae bacterium]
MSSLPTVPVRQARPEDEAALIALDAISWSPQSGFPSVIEAGHREQYSFFSADNPPHIHLVAVLGGAVAGYVRLKPPTPLPENAHVLMVAGIAVHPSARRQGVAAALLTAAEQYAVERGAPKLSLRVLGSNEAAIALYERLGFEREGVLRDEFLIEGSYVDDIAMAKHLPAAGRRAGHE